MKSLRLLTVVILLISGVLLVAAHAKKRQDSDVPTPRAHHVIYADWAVAKDGSRTLNNLRVRDVKTTGAWMEWTASLEFDTVHKNDRTDPTKTGNYKTEGQGYRSAAFWRSHAQFVSEETILGYPCFRLRSARSDDDWVEMSLTPALGSTPLRFQSSGGMLLEALKVY